MDRVLLLSLALLAGACFPSAPLATGGAALVSVLLLGRAGVSLRWLLVLVVAMGLAALRGRQALASFEAQRVTARDALGAPARCSGVVRVATSPALSGEYLGYLADSEGFDCEGRQVPAGRIRLYGAPADVARGDRLQVVAQLAPVRLFRNIDLGDPAPFAARRGAQLSGMALSVIALERSTGWRGWVDRARAHARERIQATFAPDADPMARALVLGENDLDPEDDVAFKRSGLAHMLAVSGTHLVFAVVALVRILGAFLVRIERLAARWDVGRFTAGMGIVLALGYADFAGGSGSAWRAAWMLTAAFGARALGRKPNAVRSLGLSLLVGAVVDPLLAFDVSFLLSAAATVGLLGIGQPLAERIKGWRFAPLRYLGLSVAATLASMLPCIPLLALLSSDLTLAGVVANVIASPFGELVALPVCLAHSLLSPFPTLERGAALVASGALLVVKQVAHASANATWLAVNVPRPVDWHFVVLGVGGLGFALTRGFKWPWLLFSTVALLAVEAAVWNAGHPRGTLRVSVLDVGQGDATLVDLPDGRLMLIDGGGFMGSPVDPGKSVILPVLRARRRSVIDIAVLSHPHPDHFTGLATVLDHMPVGEFWDTGQGEAEGAGPLYAKMLRAVRQRAKVLGPRELCGKQLQAGAARLRVLGPCPRFTPHRDANDNSLVIHISLGGHAVLLTGDAESHQEAELIAQHGAKLRADFLKVGHHGSRTSSSLAFLREVQPVLATISCGVRNRYGHPHTQSVRRLLRAGVRPLRIDRRGSVTWQTNGNTIEARAFGLPR